MLREMKDVRQIEGERRRRWFYSERMDLTVWVDEIGAPMGFQLSYEDAAGMRKALTWHEGQHIMHESLDEGEDRPFRYKMTPITLPDGAVDYGRLYSLFMAESGEIDPAVREYVSQRLRWNPP